MRCEIVVFRVVVCFQTAYNTIKCTYEHYNKNLIIGSLWQFARARGCKNGE